MKRRAFLRDLGLGAAGAILVSCAGKTGAEDADADAPVKASHHKRGPITMRTNPNTSDSVSILGYGCMRLPSLSEDPESESYNVDQEEVNRQVDYALAHGVNYFDTSPAYCKGESEAAMGIALSRHPRDKYLLATKLSNFAPQTWPAAESQKMFENSLKNLKTDHVDYLLMHAIGMSAGDLSGMEAYEERYIKNGMLAWLEEQKKAGRIRNLGFSYHGDVEVFDRLLREHDEGLHHWDFVQIQLNYVDWENAKEVNPRNTNASYLYNELAKRNIPVVIMEPLLGGRLADVPTAVAAKMKQRRPDDSPAAWAFRFAGTPEKILTVLSGMTYMDHLKENVSTFSSLDPITEDENAFLMRVGADLSVNGVVPCTGCSYCMPCPYGLDIPTIFDFYNTCVNEDMVPHDKRHPRYAEARKRFLIGMSRAVPADRQPSRCIACGECLKHCPQGIAIPDEMAKIERSLLNLRNNA